MSDQASDPSVSVTGVKDACSYRPGPADKADCPDDWEGERERTEGIQLICSARYRNKDNTSRLWKARS